MFGLTKDLKVVLFLFFLGVSGRQIPNILLLLNKDMLTRQKQNCFYEGECDFALFCCDCLFAKGPSFYRNMRI